MAVSSAQISVGTTATALNAAETDQVIGAAVLIRNPAGGANVFLGGPDVTTANGFLLAAGEVIGVDLVGVERLYAIVASGTQTVHVLRTG